MRVKLRKVGNSLTVTIPYEIAEELCLTEGSELNIVAREDKVVLETFKAEWDRVCEPIQKRAEELGVTEEDVIRWVEEMRYGKPVDE